MFLRCEPSEASLASRPSRGDARQKVRGMSQPSHPFPTILARTLLLCFFVILGCLPTGGGQEGGQGQTATSSQFPVVVDDIRYFHNLTEQRVGAPIKLWIRDPNQYSRIFFSQREGELSTEVLEGIVPGKDVVLDIGPNVGVFALTAARLGARVVAVEADGAYAASVSQGAKINGLEDKLLVAEWLPSSHEGFATVFAKGERGCTYTGPATCNMTGQQEYVRAVNLVTMRTVDGALNNGMIPRPTVVRIDAEGSEEAVLEGAKGLFEMSASEGAPRLVLMIVYPYQLRRVLQWMLARGYQARPPPDEMSQLGQEWESSWSDPNRGAAGGGGGLEAPEMFEWYKEMVHNFFRAQMQNGGVEGVAFLFEKIGAEGQTLSPSSSSSNGDEDGLGTAKRRDVGSKANRGREEKGRGNSTCKRGAIETPGGGTGTVDGRDNNGEGEDGVYGGSEEPLTLVTGCSSDYFPQLQNLIGSLHVYDSGTPVLVYDLGLTREQRVQVRSWEGVELVRFPFESYPAHLRTLANYAWKIPLILEAASRATNILYLDTGIELRNDLSPIRHILSHDGYFFTTQGCNIGDAPEVPCDVQESCTVGDKTPPGVIKRLFGLERDTDYPHLFAPCIAGGMIGINQETEGGLMTLSSVLRPASACAMDLECIYPKHAIAIINSNFDMAPLGLLVHAAGVKYHGGRRFNAALFSALHTPEVQVLFHQVVLYTRRRFGGSAGTPFAEHVRIDKGYRRWEEDERGWGGDVVSHNRGETGLLYETPSSIDRNSEEKASVPPTIYPLSFGRGNGKTDREGGEDASGECQVIDRGARGQSGDDDDDDDDGVYVSIVLSARNDDHEGNFMTRLQASLEQLAASASMHPKLSAELVIVEWDPPHHRPPLRDALRWPIGLPPTRIIRVPSEIHSSLPQVAKDGFPQFYAKNVGMRRAVGRYILVTNGDVLIGEALIKALADKQLEDTAFYRIDRHDLWERFHPSMPPGRDMTAACQHATKKVNTMQKLGVGALLHEVDLAWEELGDLRVTTHGHLKITFPDDVVARTQYWDAVNLLGGVPIVDHPVPVHGATVRERPREMENLHTYADGDFFIASKAAIESLRGYPEIPLPILVDSLLTVQASAHGLAQKIFMPPACIFHQFHEQGTMPERVARTVGEKEVESFIANVTKMLGEGKPMVFNGGDWGYGQQSFEEHLID